MATILSGDIQVDYLNSNRQKRLSWAGSTGTYTMNEIYSAMATLLDETTTIDSGTCFSAETPTEYTIGQIDTGDTEPWYITFDLMEHVTGGALRTSGWTRALDTNAGIFVVPVTNVNVDSGDEGSLLTHADTDAGTLLEFIDTGGATDYLVIRPASSAVGNDFSTSTGTITITTGGHTATQNAAATTGEMIWAGLYSLGTIDPNVHQYLYQGSVATDGNRVRLTSWNDATQDWLDNYQTNGHIDTTVPLMDVETAGWPIIDEGYVTVLARKYGDYYASFEVACSDTSGGYNPVPLGTSTDIDNTTGNLVVSFSGAVASGPFVDGEIITGGTSGARGILDLSNSTVTDGGELVYTPIDDPQIAFNGTETITGAGGANVTNDGAPAASGPALNTWFTNNTVPTIEFTHIGTADIDDDGSPENYGITIHCQSNPLTEVYEWVKYITRNGATEQTASITIYGEEGINGEDYIGGEVYLAWSGDASGGSISEGDDVTQTTSGATGVVIAFDDTADVMLLRDTRGTFDTASAVTSTEGSGAITPTSVSTFAPKVTSPLGTFAGGTFFGARGVLLTNYITADANSFILTPIEGGTKEVPASFTIEVTNLVGGSAVSDTNNQHDKVAVFRLTGSGADIDKGEYVCAVASKGAASIAVTTGTRTAIVADTPGKTTGGVLILVDDSDSGAEYRLRYSSWTGTTFTLAEVSSTTTSDSGTSQVNDSGGSFITTVKRGDCVTTASGSSHVQRVHSDILLTLETADCAMGNSVAYEINSLPVATTTDDTIYVPFLDEVALTDTASVSVQYDAQIYYRGKVRNTRNSTKKIKPFSVDGTTSGTDVSIATIRTEDTIIN